MPCLIGLSSLFFPRIILFLVWLLGNGWLQESFQTVLFPVLGFLFLPLTTLAYAWAWHSGGGDIQGAGIVVIVIAVLVDLGMLGGGSVGSRRSSAR
ncbi:MAG: hypothetical protein P8J45_13770 [Phycisphaerales bacterium]|jgi:hypothetical protein|nr:hypothetical protein [Phycisphaerales bacterium]